MSDAPVERRYTRAEVIDWMWRGLRPFAFQYSPSKPFYAQQKAHHREQFAKMLDAPNADPADPPYPAY